MVLFNAGSKYVADLDSKVVANSGSANNDTPSFEAKWLWSELR